jgi:amino acid adenylation domain-containing protein
MTHTLTSSQREIWFDQALRQRSSTYNIGGYMSIAGAVDPERFERAINLLIRKHDCLRTVLVYGRTEDAVPEQSFAAEMSVRVPLRDFSHEADPHASALAWMQTRFDEPFDLLGEPLTRHDLLKVGPGLYYWLLQCHHIIVDGWSIALLCRSLAEIYSALEKGSVPDLMAHSYVEFIADDRSYVHGEIFQRQQRYWLEKYQNLPEPLLKARYQKTLVGSVPRSECCSLRLPRSFYDRLIAFAKASHCTTFHVILAALYVYFVRTGGGEELVVGMPVLNRSNAAHKATAGLFVGVSAVRFALGTNLSFVELLRGVGRVLKQDYRHQRFPVSELNREVLRQHTGRQQLFDLRVSYEKHDHDTMFGAAPGRARALLNSHQTTPLTVFVREFHDDDDVDLDFVYNQAYFQRDEIEAVQQRLWGVLNAVLSDPEIHVERVPLVTSEDFARLAEWNQTQVELPTRQTVVELFEQQVARSPEALAVSDGAQRLSYAQLNERVTQLAHQLRAEYAVGPEVLVGLCVDRSVDMLVALLAVLKAGGAYVPLDPSYPAERLRYMLEDAAPKVVLTQKKLLALLPEIAGEVVLLEEIAGRGAKQPSAPEQKLDARNLVYVIYTSGSTGRPKGTAMTHRAMVNLIEWHRSHFERQHGVRVLQFAALSFDVAFQEIFTTLCTGGTLVLLEEWLRKDAHALNDFLSSQKIERLFLPPLMLQSLAECVQGGAAAPSSLKDVITAGEQLRVSAQVRSFFARLESCRLHNHYGPTEAHVVTALSLQGDAQSWPELPSIGRPIANTRIYLLDARGEPVPPGVVGEIHISGAGVARGYLNRPEVTADRFLQDPFIGEPGARMYRTGDLGRYLSDGTIEYLGRNDEQVKIRGFRIELGEIETRLSAQPGVREAVVLAREAEHWADRERRQRDATGEKRLVAYVVSEGTPLNASQLRKQLSRELPEYMVPAAYVQLEALPLTPNGKLDRRTLPAPEGAAFAQQAYEAPQGELESALARIWSEVLQIEHIGRCDHFFELGGHSLLAVQLISRVRRQLGLEVPLQALFAQPVLQDFALQVSQAQRSQLPPLQALYRPEHLPLSFAQQRLWFITQMDAAAGAAYHMPAGLKLRGQLDEVALKRSLDRIVARHEALRTHFDLVEGQPVQRIAPASVGFEWQHQDLSSLNEEQQSEQVRYWRDLEAHAPFDLNRGPLIRGRLLKLAEQEHVLLMTMHHIVSDGWSIGVLVRELGALYRAFSQGQADPLPVLKIQYADYALWQRQWQQESMQAELTYWQQQLQGAPELVSLPTDHPRPAMQDYAGERIEVELGAQLSGRLRALSHRHGTTLHMILLGAWAAQVGRLSGQEEVVIGTPVANRTQAEMEGLIGFFVNTLPLRMDLSGSPSVSALLDQARRRSVQAQAHQSVPFEQVVEVLKPTRALSHSPIFQLMFAWQNTPRELLDLGPALSLENLPSGHRSVKYDLTLSLQEQGDRIVGELEYATALYERSTMQRHVEYLQALLRGMVADEEQLIERLPLLSEAERHQLLVGWNQTQHEYCRESCIHELFEEQVERTPDALALVYEEQSLTYAQLNAHANRLARYLQELGVGSEVRVGICAERSLEMVVSVLATLKAGGAYVPLDPTYPVERLNYMLRDSGPRVLLVHAVSEVSSQLRQSLESGLLIVDVRADAHRWSQQSSQNLDREHSGARPHHLAYVIYTSGSTGEPKGVAIEHRNTVNFIHWAREAFTQEQLQHTLFSTSLSFDLAVYECWVPLSVGATVHVVGNALQARQAPEVTMINTVPSALAALLQQSDAVPASVRTVNLAGEPLRPSLVQELFVRSSVDQVCNLYGPTETTTYSTWVRMNREQGFQPHIGRPIANTRIYILDKHGQPTPLGVAGEIYIGGAGVARGYLNRPELTAQRFLEDPFSGESGARMYRTGDVGRYLADRNIEYLGRNDEQVKIRGFRIELGEIEARLSAQPGVREAVVLAREAELCADRERAQRDALGEKRLVAYVVSERTSLDVSQLREQLSRELPEYMVPAAYVQLEALPRTPNGKLDRRALPAPEGAAFAQHAYEPPQGRTEEAIAQIWSDLLSVERIGRQDHFFELGGHSLMAVRLLEQMRRRGLYSDIRTLFAQPSLRGFAQATRETQQPGWREAQVPPNGIKAECGRITPSMLPLVDLTQEQVDQIVCSVPGGAANVQDIYPLAPLQEGILFHHLLQANGDAYLLRTVLSFESQARLNDFVQALQSVIERHDILRTSVLWEKLVEPVQVVWRQAAVPVEQVELRNGEDAVEQLLNQFDPRRYRLDVRQAPLMKMIVAHDAVKGRWLLLQLWHHLCADYTTVKVIQDEIETYLSGHSKQLPVPRAFRSFVAQGRLGVSREEHEEFFRELLGTVCESTIPFGLQDVQSDGSEIREQMEKVDDALAQRLRRQARALRVSVVSLFHLAFAQVLRRASGRDDVVFGTVLMGRMQGGEGIERVPGVFINTLPVRIRLDEQGVDHSARETHELLGRLLRHEHASLALVQRCSAVKAPAPLFSAVLNYRYSAAARSPVATKVWEGVQFLHTEERSNFPLMLAVDDLGEGFRLSAQVRSSHNPARVCSFMLCALEQLVDALEHTPERSVRSIDVLPPHERQQLLQWNATETAYESQRCIHELFEAQVARTQDAIAVVHEDQSLTYAELNGRSNQLARYLKAKGVSPDALVAICVERGLELIVGLLGILKAGGAYVPLDPAYPPERLRYMLKDSAPKVLLTQERLKSALPATTTETIALDSDWSAIAAYGNTNLLKPVSRNLAYMIYTSGSTGRPKGVLVEHEGVVNCLTSLRQQVGISAADRMLAITTVSFDIAALELYLPLFIGAQVIMAGREAASDPTQLMRIIEERSVTLMQATPTTWQMLLAGGWSGRSSLTALSGGEALRTDLSREMVSRVGALWNLYGPTETTIWSCIRQITAMPEHGVVEPIGQPIANTRIYILDSQMQLAPIGVAGELYIGGAGVARGYLNQPELTTERFVADPFTAGAQARMYKTGDLGQWRADGTIEFLGRNDHQVKIRGFRIELGEIEAQIARDPRVKAALVVAREDVPGETRLVAYITQRDRDTLSVNDLRAHLMTVLPEYMVPSAFVRLESFPLTPNGKLDRRALPAPNGRAYATREYEAPIGVVENALAQIWSELLRVERIGRRDNFFELGGHSLTDLKLVARIAQELDVELQVQAVFQHPTVQQMARLIESLLPETRPELEEYVL